MSNWFNNRDHPSNAIKGTILREIFKVAIQQERFNNGEIGMWLNQHQYRSGINKVFKMLVAQSQYPVATDLDRMSWITRQTMIPSTKRTV